MTNKLAGKLFLIPGVFLSGLVLAQPSVDELVSISAEQLVEQQEQASKRAEAMLRLISGAVEAPVPEAEGESEAQVDVLRPEVVREGEPSVSGKPTESSASRTHELTFAQIRSKLEGFTLVEEALRELQAFVQNHPRHREARLLLARTYSINVEHERVLAVLRPTVTPLARDSHPDWQPWFWTGTAYLALGELSKARQHLDIAVTKNGGLAEIWVQLAVLEQELENHAIALQYLDVAAQLDASKAVIYLNRAYSLERLGRAEEAVDAFQRFLVTDIDRPIGGLRPGILRHISSYSPFE